MTENKLVSVIVPFYNVEKYIKKCIESLLHQTYRNLEIIIVNDGSQDNSEKEIADLVDNDGRCRLVRKQNGGISDARNYGLKYAKGEYVIFVDSDDYVEDRYIETLMNNAIEYNADISVCNFYYEYKGNLQAAVRSGGDMTCTKERMDSIKDLYRFDSFGVAAWNKLFRRDLLWDDPFPTGKVSEEYYIMYKIFSKANKPVYSYEPLYHYVQREKSYTKSGPARMFVIDSGYQFKQYCTDTVPELLGVAKTNLVFQAIGVYNTGKVRKNLSKEQADKLINIVKLEKDGMETDYVPFSRKAQLFLFCNMLPVYSMMFIMFKRIRMKTKGR